MKKKKAAALARKQEAEKQLSAKKLKMAASAQGGIGESVAEIDNKSDENAIKESTVEQKSPLSPVAENAEVNTTKAASTAEGSTPKPIMFGSSATVTAVPVALGIPKSTALPSEPDCPKPSFFGNTISSFGTPAPSLSGAPSLAAAFGSGATTTFAFGDSASMSSPEVSDAKKDPQIGGGSDAFLNLTPPGKSGGMQGKFVFGKSANITLAVPSGTSLTAAQTLASFGKAGMASPFGGGFGASPFGGGFATLPLTTPSTEETEQSKESDPKEEEGEVPDGEVAASTEPPSDTAADKK
jgi:nucleoprotein TPR